jgi:hypothetical protein
MMSPSDTQRPPNSFAPYNTVEKVIQPRAIFSDLWRRRATGGYFASYLLCHWLTEFINRRRNPNIYVPEKLPLHGFSRILLQYFAPAKVARGLSIKQIHIYSTFWAEGSFAE